VSFFIISRILLTRGPLADGDGRRRPHDFSNRYSLVHHRGFVRSFGREGAPGEDHDGHGCRHERARQQEFAAEARRTQGRRAQVVRYVRGRVGEYGEQQAAPRAVVDPANQEREGHGRHHVQAKRRTRREVAGEEPQRQVPKRPHHAEEQVRRQRAQAPLEPGERVAAPAHLLVQAAADEGDEQEVERRHAQRAEQRPPVHRAARRQANRDHGELERRDAEQGDQVPLQRYPPPKELAEQGARPRPA
jgi:hypothetical protein